MRIDEARRAIEAGRKKAEEMGVLVSIAVVDEHGDLVLLERMEGAIPVSPQIAWGKAAAAALFRRSTREFEEIHKQNPVFWTGVTTLLSGRALFRIGGVPIVKNGRILGAVGVSGATGEQDDAIASEAVKSIQ